MQKIICEAAYAPLPLLTPASVVLYFQSNQNRLSDPKGIKNTVDSLSRTRLSRITAYREVKIWSLSKPKHLTTGKKKKKKKKCGKRGEIAPKEQFLLFFTIVLIYLFQESNYIYICEMWLFEHFFLSSANLICRGTDISKYLIESFGIRDDESRLYILQDYKVREDGLRPPHGTYVTPAVK